MNDERIDFKEEIYYFYDRSLQNEREDEDQS